MPSPIGEHVPLCGAKSKRSQQPCKNRAMPNGRCRMHGGKSTGPPRGSTNAIKHGIYSNAVAELERAMWDRIPIGTVDDEIRILKLRLRRVLVQQEQHHTDPENPKLLELTKVERLAVSSPLGKRASAGQTRTRPDFNRLILSYTRRIGELEQRRAVLIAGGETIHEKVTFIIEGA